MEEIKGLMFAVFAIGLLCIAMYLIARLAARPKRNARLEQMMKEMISIIHEHKPKLTGNNRFIIDLDVLRSLFPYDTPDNVHALFSKLIDDKIIGCDPMDNAWCIR